MRHSDCMEATGCSATFGVCIKKSGRFLTSKLVCLRATGNLHKERALGTNA